MQIIIQDHLFMIIIIFITVHTSIYIVGKEKVQGRNYAVGLRTPYAVWCGSIAVNSDIRIKKDIENVPDNLSLEKLRNIECVYYNYKNEEDNGPHKVIGFIAQQVKQHLPTAVNLKKK